MGLDNLDLTDLFKVRLLRPDQAATILHKSTRTIRRLIRTKELDSLRVGGSRRITYSSVQDYLRREIKKSFEKSDDK